MSPASCIPIPEGLELPEGQKQFDLVATFMVEDGMLKPLAIDGIPIPEPEEGEAEPNAEHEMGESPEELGREGEGPRGGMGPGPASQAQGGSSMGADQGFMAAIEAALGKPKGKRS